MTQVQACFNEQLWALVDELALDLPLGRLKFRNGMVQLAKAHEARSVRKLHPNVVVWAKVERAQLTLIDFSNEKSRLCFARRVLRHAGGLLRLYLPPIVHFAQIVEDLGCFLELTGS